MLENGQTLKLAKLNLHKADVLIATFQEITSRELAESFTGKLLKIPRNVLPKPKANEFYIADLIGLECYTEANQFLGTIASIQNYGAGDVVEIILDAENQHMIIFNAENFPDVDIKNRRVVVVLPEMY